MVKAAGYCFLEHPTDQAMQRYLLRNGPAAVAIDTSGVEFMFLKGVFYMEGNISDHLPFIQHERAMDSSLFK